MIGSNAQLRAHSGDVIPVVSEVECKLEFGERIRYRRLKKLVSSHRAIISWSNVFYTWRKRSNTNRNLMTWVKGIEVKTKEQETRFWSSNLHVTFDGAPLSGAKLTPNTHGWVRGMPYLSDKE